MKKENKTEEPYEDVPWALKPIEGVKCRDCIETTINGKRVCNWNGCPYDLSGDDGMY